MNHIIKQNSQKKKTKIPEYQICRTLDRVKEFSFLLIPEFPRVAFECKMLFVAQMFLLGYKIYPLTTPGRIR